MNTTNKFFETKQQYLNFRKAFADAQNNPRAKKGKPDSNGYKQPGWLTSAHYVLLNRVRGLSEDRGFTNKTNQVFLENGGTADQAITNAKNYIARVIGDAYILLNKDSIEVPSWYGKTQRAKDKFISERTARSQAAVNIFLEPFGDTFTLMDLVRVNDPAAKSGMRIITKTYTVVEKKPVESKPSILQKICNAIGGLC